MMFITFDMKGGDSCESAIMMKGGEKNGRYKNTGCPYPSVWRRRGQPICKEYNDSITRNLQECNPEEIIMAAPSHRHGRHRKSVAPNLWRNG